MMEAVKLLLQVSAVDVFVVPCASDSALARHCSALVTKLLSSEAWDGVVMVEVSGGVSLEGFDHAHLPHYRCPLPSPRASVPPPASERVAGDWLLSSKRRRALRTGWEVLVWLPRAVSARGTGAGRKRMLQALVANGCLGVLSGSEVGADAGAGAGSAGGGAGRGREGADPLVVGRTEEGGGEGGRAERRSASPRVLHLGFHNGLAHELAGIGRQLGVRIDFEPFPREGRDTLTQYNVDAAHSRLVWERHKHRWIAYDVVVTSDTAPTARPLLEQALDQWSAAAGKRLVVWVCNRFDYRHSAHALPHPQRAFPETAFYDLYARASNGSLGGHVTMVPYTEFERVYAAAKGVYMSEPVLRPAGFKSANAARQTNEKEVEEASGAQDDRAVGDMETLFLPPRANDKLMEGQCMFLGLSCLRDAALSSLDAWRAEEWIEQQHAPVTYQDARELRRFKALVHIPYAWSTLALWEFLQAELVILVPSARFFLELTSSCVAWGQWLCLALGEQRAQTFSLWFQDFQYVTSAQELEYSEWWSTDLAHVLIHFDSWEELEYLVFTTDWEAQRGRIASWVAQHSRRTLERWRQLLGVHLPPPAHV
eukprot:Tamp_07180.p1 GENE.Tamp_07180~~Tamp_07180.p1  ORF type:complete len:596 (-),score=108.25 Tamp_07180:765-2552(-)